MALSYRRPSLFCEPASVFSVWVWAHLLRCILSAFLYTETQNTTGAHLGNRKPPFLSTPLFLPVFPGCPPPSTTIQTVSAAEKMVAPCLLSTAIKTRWADIEYIHVKTYASTCEAMNKAIVAYSWVQDRGIAQRTGGQILFHLPDHYVPYLVGCDGTQLGWNEYELIN